MGPERLKAFTDGVLAIIITIMVLELRAPHNAALSSLRPLVPVVLSYALSFVYLVIYWNNHQGANAIAESDRFVTIRPQLCNLLANCAATVA